MNKSQKMMVEDGLPLAFVMSDDDRLDWWKRYPPKNTQAFLDPRIEQDRLLRETMKQEATKKRIMALRQSKGLIDASEQTTNPNQPQESNMPKYTVKPLDAHGHPVIRAITSINDDAAEEEINQKVLAAAKRGGSKVANVLLINTLSEVVLAWSIVEGVAGPCDAGPFQPVMQPPDGVYRNLTNEPEVQQTGGEPVEAETNQPETKESDVSKKVKKGKAKKAAPKRAKSDKPRGEKTLAISELLSRVSGCTAKEVLAATGWPSVSMPAMAKACGLKLRKDKVKGQITRYFGS
jgi:hypothetical protein